MESRQTHHIHASSRRQPRSDSAITRARIMDVAERLFAERGVDGVSLREINAAAGQNNKSALQYHFRSKIGLLQAILEKHRPAIEQQQHAMLDAIEASGRLSLRALAAAVVAPLAAKLDDPDGGVAFIRINAQLIGHPQYALFDLFASRRSSSTNRHIQLVVRAVPKIPASLHHVRGLLISSLVFHALADYSHRLEQPRSRKPFPARGLFVSNLIDNVVGLYRAPVSAETRGLMRQGRSAPTAQRVPSAADPGIRRPKLPV